MDAWMRASVVLCLGLGLGGCLPGPDRGGQEGEEIRQDAGAEATDTANLEDSDTGDDAGGGDGGDDGGDDGDVDESDWVSWTGLLTLEQGLTLDAGDRDCVLTYRMEGAVSPLECDGCTGVFDVVHILEPAASTGLDACPDARDAFAATYAIAGEEGMVQLFVGDGSGGFVELAEGELADGHLAWTAGEADAPESSGDETLYRTSLQTGDVQLR